jgi:hypothetical protein
MADKTDADTPAVNYLDMSDEDMLKQPTPNFSAGAGDAGESGNPKVDEPPVDDPKDAPAKEEPKGDEPKDGDDEPTDLDDKGEKKDETTDPAKKADEVPVDEKNKDRADKKAEPEKKDEKVEKVDGTVIDYKAEYERLIAPFQANGRQVQVKSVDDAIALMQMGANYNKKMAALKPNLKMLKLLENNGLLNEEKLSYLIDLDKKDPAAINKLVKDSGLNPLDLDADKASAYTPKSRQVDDRELALDEVLDAIKDTPSYQTTLNIIGTKWDKASKQIVGENPQLIQVINDHVARGIYDLISKEVENERLFGRLTGVSDFEAYRQVGDAIQDRGGFDHLSTAAQRKSSTAAKEVIEPKPKQGGDDKLNEKRRAASSATPGSTPAKHPLTDLNPLDMPDEEFEKAAANRFK